MPVVGYKVICLSFLCHAFLFHSMNNLWEKCNASNISRERPIANILLCM